MKTVFAVVSRQSDGDDILAIYPTREAAETHGGHWPKDKGKPDVIEVVYEPTEGERSGAWGAQVDTLGQSRIYWSESATPGQQFPAWELNDGWEAGANGFKMSGHFRAEAYEATKESALASALRLLPPPTKRSIAKP